jgi:hypothetical protein
MIMGGSFMSTGDEASVFARFHFRPHFHQVARREPAPRRGPAGAMMLIGVELMLVGIELMLMLISIGIELMLMLIGIELMLMLISIELMLMLIGIEPSQENQGPRQQHSTKNHGPLQRNLWPRKSWPTCTGCPTIAPHHCRAARAGRTRASARCPP